MADVPRIVVALDPSVSEASAFDVLRYFRDLDADLAGVFVEDSNLLSHARSSLAREIDAHGARDFAIESLERQLHVRSAEMRRYFESLARAMRGRHSFHVARGEVAAEIERVAANCELLVIGVALAHRGLRARSGCRCPPPHGRWRIRRRFSPAILDRRTRSSRLWCAASPDVAAVGPTALRVARTSHAPLRVLVVADGAQLIAQTRDAIADTRDAIASALAGFDTAVRYDVIADRTSATLERAVRSGTQDGCALVLAAGDGEADAELLRSLLEETTWNIVLVRNAVV